MPWNKKLAWSAFWSNLINEREYGYIVADIENTYFLNTMRAEALLLKGEITQSQYEKLIAEAKNAFHGQ
ncbi:hypothetical protein DRW07_11570 [Alteromonas sediminis]|uniref:Uncharacterized protein n=1 Tax=Alteromonas sediminis TaxID=2259342 RepID=A0A3N5ZAV2_9ALTE|nr:hypothetical protein [Alteromonas sediminis]RPJ66708.1 hypothetical protein DRW07_11570 [Alteromonas sediminis]